MGLLGLRRLCASGMLVDKPKQAKFLNGAMEVLFRCFEGNPTGRHPFWSPKTNAGKKRGVFS